MSKRFTRGLLSTVLFVVAVHVPAASAATVDAVEYHHGGFNHYFVTAFPEEAAVLDAGTVVKGWTRTGKTFKVESTPVPNGGAVCRFFSTSFAPRSSHFYTADPTECDAVKTNADWQFEATAFHGRQPDASGSCPAGSLAVYRLYNNGASGAPNHRYTTDRTTRAEMIAQGWTPEGYGEGVVLCTSPVGPSVALCVKSDSFFGGGCSATGIPYVSSGTMQATLLGATSIKIESFRLTVSDAPVTITQVTAVDLNGVASASISGIAPGQQIQPGQTVDFDLVSGLTRGRQASLRFVVEAGGAPLVDVSYLLLTN